MPPTVDGVLASLLRAQDGGHTLLERFCAACMASVDVTGVALTLIGGDGQQLLAAASDPLAARLGELEFTLGQGPGTDANGSGVPALAVDLRDSRAMSRWPAYASAASETPIRSQFSFPLQIGVIRLGGLTLYRDRSGSLSEDDLTGALVLADVATVLLLHLQDVGEVSGELHPDLGVPFVASAELHQATGMISVQAAVGMREALLLLRARAFSSDGSPLEVARAVVAGSINFRRETGS